VPWADAGAAAGHSADVATAAVPASKARRLGEGTEIGFAGIGVFGILDISISWSI
jgi:hypothetical protein